MKIQSLPLPARPHRRGRAAASLATFVLVAVAAASLVGPSGALAQAGAGSASSAAAIIAPGLVYRSLREGTGASPSAADSVQVHYRGTLLDGTEFDSSYARKEPATFPLNRVIKCWTEGVQRMKVGGKAELVCPPELAYGTRGAGGMIPPNATLRFEVELLAINPR
ncbi:MAG TPA: FKBP-type peptidyl-prolyl cis-trans isomerase [Caldimonas sp.]|nr:FKBP-type peptidyl-prolyl cis-trans isomerase [Caldimonas sp.]